MCQTFAEGQGKRERAERRIESWAKENGYWIDEDEFAKNAEKVKDGTESHGEGGTAGPFG